MKNIYPHPTPRKLSHLAIILLGLSPLICIQSLQAQIAWINDDTFPATWSDGANWAGGTPPGSGEAALFNNNATGTINFTADVLNLHNFQLENTSGALTFNLQGNKITGNSNTSHFAQLRANGTTATFIGGEVEYQRIVSTGDSANSELILDGLTYTAIGIQRVQFSGSNNTIRLINGATITTTGGSGTDDTLIGSSSANISMIVSGAGSALNLGTELMIGRLAGADNNLLRIEDGGSMTSSRPISVGNRQNNQSNRLEVSGEDATLTHTNTIWIGGERDNEASTHNTLRVDNGGHVAGNIIHVGGRFNESEYNRLEVAGGTLSGRVNVGSFANHNTLEVSDGGSITTTEQFNVGVGTAGPTHNLAVVTGDGSSIAVTNSVVIGERLGANLNVLRVEDGGSFSSTGGMEVGHRFATNSRLEVVGADSEAIIGANIWIGGSRSDEPSTGNAVLVQDGGLLEGANSIFVGGSNSGSSSNRLDIDGGTVRTPNSYLEIGRNSGDNVLELTNGGVLEVGEELRFGSGGAASNELNILSGSSVVVSDSVDIQGGTLLVDGGSLSASSLSLLAADAAVTEILFPSGLIESTSASVAKGDAFVIGDPMAGGQAVYRLLGGTHSYDDGITLQDNARIEGSGILDAGITLNGPGIELSVGSNGDFGILEINSNWDNTQADIILSVGDLSAGTATPGEHYDYLDLNGAVNAGGTILLDLEFLQLPASGELTFAVFQWNSVFGNTNDFDVLFSDPNSNLSYAFQSDGLYLTAIPEARGFALMAGLFAIVAALFVRSRQRR